jgi:uncharacterized protein
MLAPQLELLGDPSRFRRMTDIVHGMNDLRVLPRAISGTLEQALGTFPVVVLTGARQTGKTTLVRNIPTADTREYRSLDLDVLERARAEPDLLVREAERLTLDEVQRAPDLLRAVKRQVDARRRPGRFLLTGSANLLLMSAVSETLAGRAVYLKLGPLTEREKSERAEAPAWSALLQADGAEEAAAVLRRVDRCPTDWRQAALSGGLPPVIELPPADRGRWLDGYVATYLERDLQQLSSISDLADFRRLLRIAALRLGGLLNRAEMARDAGLSRATAHRWVNLLDVSFQLRLLPPYVPSRTKRLVKSPKLYFGDTGLAARLAGISTPEDLRAAHNAGAWLENLLVAQLDAWRETQSPRPEILFWRTAEGAEIDLVIESGRRLLPIEVKTTTRARSEDAAALERFLDQHRGARYGVLAHDGTQVQLVTPRVVAAPIDRLV